MKNKTDKTVEILRERERERERESYNLNTIEPRTKIVQKANNKKIMPNNKPFDVKKHATKTSIPNTKTAVGALLKGEQITPKQITKLTSNVPTSNFQHPTSSVAITLIALVITIVVLLILSGVTLNMVLGQNGIFRKANEAKEETRKTNALEDVRMKVLEAQTKTQAEEQRKATLEDVVIQLEKAKQDTYKVTTTTSKIAKLEEGSITAKEAQNLDAIYVTNTKYGHEVKIDKMLQIALTGQTQKEETNKTYTITFNANGGEIEKISKQITYDEQYGELETPTRTGYNFNGWYTEKEGGTQITSNMKYTIKENQTLYAHWLEKTYVSQGLMLHYDGTNNTGNGQHSNSATTWKDLSGNGNDGILNGGTWENNCLKFDGIDDWVNCGRQDYSNVTMEIVTSYEKTRANNISIVANTEQGGYGICISSQGKFWILGGKEEGGYNVVMSDNIAMTNKLYAIGARIGAGKITLNENDTKYNLDYEGELKQTTKETVCILGDDPTGGGSSYSESFCGRIYSVRIYNRILTDKERENNYEIDKVKYGIN